MNACGSRHPAMQNKIKEIIRTAYTIADSNNFFFECDRSNSNAKIPHATVGRAAPATNRRRQSFTTSLTCATRAGSSLLIAAVINTTHKTRPKAFNNIRALINRCPTGEPLYHSRLAFAAQPTMCGPAGEPLSAASIVRYDASTTITRRRHSQSGRHARSPAPRVRGSSRRTTLGDPTLARLRLAPQAGVAAAARAAPAGRPLLHDRSVLRQSRIADRICRRSCLHDCTPLHAASDVSDVLSPLTVACFRRAAPPGALRRLGGDPVLGIGLSRLFRPSHRLSEWSCVRLTCATSTR